MFQLKHIDNGFYLLTAQQARALSSDGELPRPGYEKRAKAPVELRRMATLLVYNWRVGQRWEERPRPLADHAQCWISRTATNWHDGKPVDNPHVWALHVYESASALPVESFAESAARFQPWSSAH